MALINCPECGIKISDKAEFCVRCGAPIEINDAVLVLERSSSLFGFAVLTSVYVDGAPYCPLRRGGSIVIRKKYGFSVLVEASDMHRSLVIPVAPCEQLHVIVSIGNFSVKGEVVE
jgi:DNA-directed RNA polymerase subunit RPC12/RpoP